MGKRPRYNFPDELPPQQPAGIKPGAAIWQVVDSVETGFDRLVKTVAARADVTVAGVLSWPVEALRFYIGDVEC
jgi:hypothetical protein